MKHAIYDQYGIRMERKISFRYYDAFWANRVLYVVIPVSHLEEDELKELQALSEFMIHRQKDIYVSSFVKNKQNEFCCEIEGKNIAIFRIPYQNEATRNLPLGSDLATFHARSRSYPARVTAINRIGQWKSLWEKRIDQMESYYYQKVRSNPTDLFDQLFVESFPYYLGLAENAIQYLVDAEMDDRPQPIDAAAICHQRFSTNTWQQQQYAKLPIDWVMDHASRDLAEWIRAKCMTSTRSIPNTVQHFIREYESVARLSSFSWRLLYARLIFPIHYLECIENYYTVGHTGNKRAHEDHLKEVLNRSDYYEQFLHSFFDISKVPTRALKIPVLDWI
ncbi:spore coat putative kinase YutH [Sutcliffiella cohnii]